MQNLEFVRGRWAPFLGLLSGLRRPPDLGYHYRRILPEKVANRTGKTKLFYSSSHSERNSLQNHQFGNICELPSQIRATTDTRIADARCRFAYSCKMPAYSAIIAL